MEVLLEHELLRTLARAKRDKLQVFLGNMGLPEINGNDMARRLPAPENSAAMRLAVIG